MWGKLLSWGGTAWSWLTGGSVLTWILLALIPAAALCGVWWGWSHGSASARNELQAEYAANVAAAYREAATKQTAAIVRANGLAMEVYNTRRELVSVRADITRRMPDAAATVSPACSFGPEYVGLLNDAFGLSAAPVPQGAGACGDQGNATAAGPAGPRLCQGASVTPLDLAAWLRDVGQWCRDNLAVSAARLKLLEDAP